MYLYLSIEKRILSTIVLIMNNLCNQRCTYYRGEGEWIRWLKEKESTDSKDKKLFFDYFISYNERKIIYFLETLVMNKILKNNTFLSHLEIVKDVTKEVLG